MKRVMYLLFVVAITLSSCVTSKGSMVAHNQVLPVERSSYTVLGETSAVSAAPKFWVLFIPFGGSSDQGLYDRAYKKAIRELKGANGLMSEQIEYKKVKVPLLLFTFVYKQVKVTGVAYHIKNDVELTQQPVQTN
jgi:hypothetical protein